ncbi:MAG: hypothetical protein EOO27_07025 [Comamonadaceae bacterium]|nr:MAG: hypothetical protein EOO27_07025 [Comamonadaceae bacterium]
MEFLFQILFWCPRCWRRLGSALFLACALLLLRGFMLAGRVERAEARSGVNIDLGKVLEALPFPLPVTPAGFALAGFGAVLGFALARAGRWAEKQF